MPRYAIPHLKILVVDDHIAVLRDFQLELKGLGCAHVDTAATVAEAVHKMETTLYSVVFLDLNMPDRSGYSLLQQCRQDSKYDKVAFVIVSSASEERYVIEALKAGATSYIVKPVLQTTLYDHLTRVIAWLDQRSCGL
jgi:two-component system, chemotaxis family, chemotaxis protein CheY